MQISINKFFRNNIEIINFSEKTIIYSRLQNYNKAFKYFLKMIDHIIFFSSSLDENISYFNGSEEMFEGDYINFILTNIVEAQENRDYILLADLLELQLNPFILKIQEMIVMREEILFEKEQYIENIHLIGRTNPVLKKQLLALDSPLDLFEKGYSIEFTSVGLFTLALQDNDKRYYLHSNGQVLKEAGILAREWFTDDVADYIIYGLGLGYHVAELMELDDSISIDVYESDINIIQLACAFSTMNKILLCDRIKIIYDPDYTKLSDRTSYLSDATKYVIHSPSLRNIKNRIIREQLEDYFVTYSSINNQLHYLNQNFRKNIGNYDYSVDVLREKFQGKDLYIVAAGPSLDNNYLKLKEIKKTSIILATGTVFKKLRKAGIKPDYIIIIDANDMVYQQIEGIEEEQIPILLLSTVYHKIVENYNGCKYLICQEGYKKAEEHAIKMNYNLYQTGGSVSTTALDIGIQLGCKRIVFIGLDLAYTREKDHASDISFVSMSNSEELRQVEDIYGNLISTGKNLDIYRKWIEKRIRMVRGVEIIDATEGGAKIHGMKIRTLEEVIYSD